MHKHQIGFVSFIRPTFDVQLAQELTERARTNLQQYGYDLIGNPAPMTSLEEAQQCADELQSQPIDLLVMFMATFNDSTMITAIAEKVTAPLLLWALPEPLDDGHLHLNSLCGINLAAHTLTKLGRKYDYIYCDVDRASVSDKISVLSRARRAQRILNGARIARIGERPPGFEPCDYDADRLQQSLGVEVVPLDLQQQLFASAKTTAAQAVDEVIERLTPEVDGLDEIDEAPKRSTLSAYVAMQNMAQNDNLHGFAVRCWPEFFSDMGCAACAAMSMLSDDGLPASCEADVNGTITQLMLQAMSGEPAFGTDLVAVVEADDAIALWHCGLAPRSMANPSQKPRVTNHVGRKLPLLMDFALKPGTVTVARLSEHDGTYRLVVGRGEMLDRPKPYHGTSGMVRLENPARDVIDTIIREGLEHHISITYGDHVDSLIALANLLDIPVLQL